MAQIGRAWADGSWTVDGWVTGASPAWLAPGVVNPTVDAGGPYQSLGAALGVQLDATVTPGSDPAPTYKWTVQSGGAGAWDDDTTIDPIFTPSTNAASVLLLTVSTTDAPDQTDTATFRAFVSQVRPGVRGKPAYPRRLQINGKRYWVRSLEEERTLVRRLYAEEEAKLRRQSSPKTVKATTYKIRRAQTRLKKIDKREAHEALLRKLDEELLFFM